MTENYVEEYEKKATSYLEKYSSQKPAMVWALLFIGRALVDLADAVRYRNNFVQFPAQPTFIGELEPIADFTSICPYCAQTLGAGAVCSNLACPGTAAGGTYGSSGK